MGCFLIRKKYCVKQYKNSACDRCERVCPNNAIAEGVIHEERCNDCGLCYSVCPAGAIATSVELDGILAEYQKQTTLTLSCREVKRGSQIPCLAILNGKALCALAQSPRVGVDLSKCGACGAGALAAITAAVAECNANLAEERKIAVVEQQRDEAAASMGRRHFLKQMLGAGVCFIEEVQNSGGTKPCRPCSLDPFICGAFTPAQAAANNLFFSCIIDGRCNACGLCAKVCPHKALRVEGEGDNIRIFFDRRLCGGCGLCESQCPKSAVEISRQQRAQDVFLVPMPRCGHCGEMFQPIGDETACLSCIQRRRILK